MPIRHVIKDDIFTLAIDGPFETIAFFDALEEGMADRAFQAPMRALIDARRADVDANLEGPEDARRLYAEIGHCFIPHWAMVAESDWVLFSIARRICTVTDLHGIHMRAYADLEEARCRLTWSNFYQQDPSCRVSPSVCRPKFLRPAMKA